jgi:predicted nucleic acid-binding protein
MMKVMKILVYLDLCCYCRLFDVTLNATVENEIKAVKQILTLVENEDIELVWSFMLAEENDNNPNLTQKQHVAQWKKYARINVEDSKQLRCYAQTIQQTGVHAADAVHVAAAIAAQANFFVSTDYRLLKYTDKNVFVCNPVQCIDIINKIL